MTAITRDHVLAATHFVLGPANFLILRLPQNWDVRIGRNPYDVDYTIFLDGVRWAQEGRATAFLVDEAAKKAMELDVRTAKAPLRPPLLAGAQKGGCRVGGHDASYALGEARYGLFRTKRFRMLQIAYRCEPTQRHVDLRFLGRGEGGPLLSLLEPLGGCRCH